MNYNFVFDEVRSSIKEGVRYARVRAIANGEDSYKSIFTKHARSSLIKQLKENGVKTNALHTSTIDSNIKKYLEDRYSKAYGSEKEDLKELIGHIQNRDFPIGSVVDAFFVEDNIVEAVIKENTELKLLGKEQKDYLDGTWNMIENGTLGGVSVVFNDLKTEQIGDRLIINDLTVRGLDFVDRAAHKDTRVIETFIRAMNECSSCDTPKMRAGETKMANELIDVDEIVAKAEEKITKKMEEQQKAKEEDAKREAELKAAKEAEEKRKAELSEIEKLKEELKSKEEEANKLKEESEEAIKIAEEAVNVAENATAKVDNPYVDRAIDSASKMKDPLEGKDFRELIKLKLQQT